MAANLFSFFFVAATDKRVAAVVQNVKASVIYGTNGIGKLTVRKVITPSKPSFLPFIEIMEPREKQKQEGHND
jgi:replication-associated recombination protein RarA